MKLRTDISDFERQQLSQQALYLACRCNKWLRPDEAAAYLGVSEKHLFCLKENAKVTFLKQKGAGRRPMIYYRREDLDRYVEREFEKVESLEDLSIKCKRGYRKC